MTLVGAGEISHGKAGSGEGVREGLGRPPDVGDERGTGLVRVSVS